jgi:isopentenyl-diphosphate delta-isomerase
MDNSTRVVLVNEYDEPIGEMEKMEAHSAPHLHRAFSVFLFDEKNRLLLQQRALHKYHSGGLWTNTCCSHPYPNEEVAMAATRRLKEEMGIEATLEKAFHFTYQASFSNGLFEHEFDHVFVGKIAQGTIEPNPDEVADYCFKTIDEIKQDMDMKSHKYTAWFKIALPHVEAFFLKNKPNS